MMVYVHTINVKWAELGLGYLYHLLDNF